ncbi:MAG: 3-phosphoshikimate 1-carboxyvinyltransferase [Synergistetes bacterium]|nr:3-phosphoshikimate 1-carboxyvinyltransferase [Synergistota bacterium]
MELGRAKSVRGVVRVPPDKSISHRALFFSSIAKGESEVRNILESDDVKRTLNLLKSCGIEFEGSFKKLLVRPRPFREPSKPLYCGNSGTTARIGMGLLASRKGSFVLYGDRSLSKRPMMRVVRPLREMGATILGREGGAYLPITLNGGDLKGIEYGSPVASAQVKSAFILASLFASGRSRYRESRKSRDHTERMLRVMGANLKEKDGFIEIEPTEELLPLNIEVPGDFSSAAFFVTLGVIHKDADIVIEGVNLNPTRTGLLRVLERMGASVEVWIEEDSFELVGRIRAVTSKLTGTFVSPEETPQMIDEIPLVALLGAFAEGETVVRGAQELRVKESDRIASVVSELRKMGIDIEELEDGFIVRGGRPLRSAKNLNAHGDHRIAMLLSIASLCVGDDGSSKIKGADWVKISFPQFYDILKRLVG